LLAKQHLRKFADFLSFFASPILSSFTSRENSFQAGERASTLPINAVLPLQLRISVWFGNAEEHGMAGAPARKLNLTRKNRQIVLDVVP